MKIKGIVLSAVFALSFPSVSGAADNTINGSLDIITDGKFVGVTNGDTPLPPFSGLMHIVNEGDHTFGLRITSSWEGSTEAPYQNNDSILVEARNKTFSTSLNRSWAGSFPNAYNYIPESVTDHGDRVGLYGWAASVNIPGYTHAGTLTEQIGVKGVAGFKGAGANISPPTAVVVQSTGVRGQILNDSPGATIQNARAGEFVSTATTGNVVNNMAIYASAANGSQYNYAFYGASGDFYNTGYMFNGGQIMVKNYETQSGSFVAARSPGNAFEFGHPDPSGYGSNIGATYLSGLPFIAFNAEADPSGNTFRTRGKPGSLILSDLQGAVIIARLPQSNASGQSHVESARFNARGNLVLSQNPPSSSSSPCQAGEQAWDANYIYVCVAADTWKRAALSSW